MTQIDQFESIFRSASRSLFDYQEWSIQTILTVCDGDESTARGFQDNIKRFVGNAFPVNLIEWELLPGDDFQSVNQLVETVEQVKPDLICTHRNLHIEASRYPYSLGAYVDVLTQVAPAPVLLLPDLGSNAPWHEETHHVMAITDHLDSDASIVTAAIKMTAKNGILYLAHIEDQRAFERLMGAIEKISEIDSDVAREKIGERLLREPREFITACQSEIAKHQLLIKVEPVVQMGHSLSEYRDLIEKHHVDLLIMHTRDADQLAMHGLAYPLTIELRGTPLLLV